MKLSTFMLGCAALFLSASAFSEECQIGLSQSTVSFGKFRQDDIAGAKKNWNRMPAKEIVVNVFCPQAQVMALFLHASAGSQGGILFGQEGRLALVADKMFVDGHHYDIVKTTDRLSFTSSASPASKHFLRNNDGIVARQNGGPIRGKQMSVTIKLVPILDSNQLRRVSDNETLESHLAWELLTMK